MEVIRLTSLVVVASYLVTISRLMRSVQSHSFLVAENPDTHVSSWFPTIHMQEHHDLDFFQNWSDTQTFSVSDQLDFGGSGDIHIDHDVIQVVAMDEVDEEDLCKAKYTDWIHPDETFTKFVYTIGNEHQLLGFRASSEDQCRSGISFTLRVSPVHHVHGQGRVITGVIVGGVAAVVVLAALIITAVMTRKRVWHRLTKFSSGRLTSGTSYGSDSTSSQSKDHYVDVEWPWGGPQRFSFQELRGATKSFSSSEVLGVGGFGTVYKGFLRDSPGSPVAVKRLSQCARQGAREFMAEVNIISQLRHRNLVQLLGWCDENEELILVYEYMPNGDLDDLIFGGYHGGDEAARAWTPLPWKQRYNIFCGVATALVYLHEEWEQRVVHRDVKTSNVMLDSQFNARLGDFGLARLSAHSQAPRTTLVAGTIGYLAPEFNLTGRATDKTDVYAFGVVIIEVSCARRPLTSNCILVDWVWELHKDEKLLNAIDPKLDKQIASDQEEMKRVLQLGLLCCHPDPSARPTMRHVLNILTGETPLPKMPRSKPVACFPDCG